ncbi:Fusarin C synthetase [Lamellibrachia satsuma]|nr:Fusarin C synthetase [Lamellibrachia satsuma]
MSPQQKIAIVGIGCRFAGGIDNVGEFWKALSEGRDCSSPLPQDRFDVAAFYHPDLKKTGKFYCERGGFLKQDVLKFDGQFFKIPPDEAEHLDPQVRLLLEVTQEAFEDAGLPARSIKGSETGVFMGVTASEYQALRPSPKDLAFSEFHFVKLSARLQTVRPPTEHTAPVIALNRYKGSGEDSHLIAA